MKNITQDLAETYQPWKALLFYQSTANDRTSLYIEAMDIDSKGEPRNIVPLQPDQSRKLAELLNHNPEDRNDFLTSRGILPPEILQVDTRTCTVIWFTRPKKVKLFFAQHLGIPEGEAFVPGLIWKATRQGMHIWAFASNRKPNLNTSLSQAPFFNIHATGSVCMGNVQVRIDTKTFLEDFIRQWEHYFFHSYFTHLLDDCPVSRNIVQLWKSLIKSGERFPEGALKPLNKTLKSILV